MNIPYTKQYYYWWQTQDDRLWWDIGYLYWENVNPFVSTGHIELSKAPTLLFSTWDNIIFDIDIDDKKIFFNEIGEILNYSWVVIWQMTVTTHAQEEEPRQVFSVGATTYMTYVDGWVLKLASFTTPTDATSASTISITAPNTSLTGTMASTTWVNNFTIIQIGNIVYLGIWKKISRLDFWTSTITNFNYWWEDITGLNYANQRIRVYTKKKIWAWDWVTEWPWEVQAFGDSIVWVSQIWDTDLIFSGNYAPWGTLWEIGKPSLYELWPNGITKLFTMSYSPALWHSKFRTVWRWPQSITRVNDFYAFIDKDDNLNERIAVYWNQPWIQKAYVVLNTKSSNWELFDDIYSVSSNGSKLYISYNNGTPKIDVIDFADNTTTYEPTGYLVTNVEDMWNKLIRKANCQLFTRLSDIDASNTVVLSSNVNLWWFTTIGTVNTLDYSEIDRQAIQWDFRDICFKVTLNSAGTTSPKLYWQQLEYEEQRV